MRKLVLEGEWHSHEQEGGYASDAIDIGDTDLAVRVNEWLGLDQGCGVSGIKVRVTVEQIGE